MDDAALAKSTSSIIVCSTEPFDTPGVSEALPRLFLSVTCLARADKKLLAFASLSSERQNSRYLRAAGRTQAAQRSALARASKGAYNSMDGLGTVSMFRKSLEVLSLVPDEGCLPRKMLCMDPRRRTVHHRSQGPVGQEGVSIRVSQ